MLSQFICIDATMRPLYLQFATKESSNKKNDQYKSHLEFENLLLYYIIKTQIQNASKKFEFKNCSKF